MKVLGRALTVVALAGVVFAARRLVGFPHRDGDYLGAGPPTAGDVAWTGWALCALIAAVLLLWWLWRKSG